jgi:hypothetical protein
MTYKDDSLDQDILDIAVKNKTICSSCRNFEPSFISYCSMLKTRDTVECPCKNCIIKMVCSKECQEYKNYETGVGRYAYYRAELKEWSFL